MTDIEKRAWEKYPEVIKHHNLAQIDINEGKRKMYIEVANEQKAIDELSRLSLEKIEWVEKACEWLKDNMPIGYDVEFGEEYDIDLNDFRKAMEE